MDKTRIVKETLDDMDRVLDVSGVSKGLKGSFVKTLKEAAGRTRGAIMHMSRVIDRVERRSSEKINKELEGEVKTLREALTDASNTMMLMRAKIDKLKEELKRYRRGKNGTRKEVKHIGTLPIIKK